MSRVLECVRQHQHTHRDRDADRDADADTHTDTDEDTDTDTHTDTHARTQPTALLWMSPGCTKTRTHTHARREAGRRTPVKMWCVSKKSVSRPVCSPRTLRKNGQMGADMDTRVLYPARIRMPTCGTVLTA